MTTLARIITTAIAAGALAAGAPARAATVNATVSANIVKPLTLNWLQDLDLGTVSLANGTWSGAKVGISRTGVFTCTAGNLICTGATAVAKYKVTGSNKGVVQITAPNVTLINQSDITKTLTLVVDSPGTVTLTSSGAPGTDFALGGSVTLDSNTAGGTYVGTFNVTVDYQ